MKILAIEMSTTQASLALVEEAETIEHNTWEVKRTGGESTLAHIKTVMEKASWTWENISAYVIGRGPGNYSNLRASMTIIQTLAMPGNQRIYAVNSPSSIAQSFFGEHKDEKVAVLGDARRGQIWYGLFDRHTPCKPIGEQWNLLKYEELESKLPRGIPCIPTSKNLYTSDSKTSTSLNLNWVQKEYKPQANILGEQAESMIQAGIESEPLTPIYIHPPV